MLTIIAIPKAFRGKFANIQQNAIRSWTKLQPRPEIILFGDDEGTADIAAAVGATHVPTIGRNAYGTPLMPSIFLKGQELASNDVVCYVNSDIILSSDFSAAVEKVVHGFKGREFLAVGRKTVIPITELLDYEQPTWERDLATRAADEGIHVTYDSDFFVFPRGMYAQIPDFAIGRCYWSSWLMFEARRRKIPMIDLTDAVLSVEPKHDYSHALSTGGGARLHGVEFRINRSLFKGCRYYTTVNSSHRLTRDGIVPAPFSAHIRSAQVRALYYVYFLLKGTWYPYSIPLILVARLLRGSAAAARSAPRRIARALSSAGST